MKKDDNAGFTLVELSVVLVIIGLLTGAIVVGQALIRVSELHATIAQLRQYNTAVTIFQARFNALPGDINALQASQFNLTPRGPSPGEGDGNGIIEGNWCGGLGCNGGLVQGSEGETSVFWVDLTTANGQNLNLIPGGFHTAHNYCCAPFTTPTSTPYTLADYLPQAKLGGGNYIYVYSFQGANYFGIAQVLWIAGGSEGAPSMGAGPGLTVSDAYDIDQKLDDGLPQTGNITAQYDTGYDYSQDDPAPWIGASDTSATTPSATTCYDNSNVSGATQKYSMAQNGGAGINCVLTFQFQ